MNKVEVGNYDAFTLAASFYRQVALCWLLVGAANFFASSSFFQTNFTMVSLTTSGKHDLVAQTTKLAMEQAC